MGSTMPDELAEQLDALARDDCYRVDAVLKEGAFETTQRVFFVGANGAEQGPYVRKYLDGDAGLGAAYERIWKAQRAGSRFLHLPLLPDGEDARRQGPQGRLSRRPHTRSAAPGHRASDRVRPPAAL